MKDLGKNNIFWQNKKVLITGHTGFKGSWLTLVLTSLGARVWGYSLTDISNYELFKNLVSEDKFINNKLFNHNEGNINDERELNSFVHKVQPDIVFHLAAQPLVRKSYKEPIKTWETNVLGTLKLMEALKPLKKLCLLVVVTSDKVYENIEDKSLFKETDRIGGDDPYSASKAATEILVASWRKSFCGLASHQSRTLSIASVRSGNVIGGGDWSEDRLIPDIVKSLHNNKVIKLRNPESCRPWLHVLDSLNGYLILAEKTYKSKQLNSKNLKDFESSFNFGPNKKSLKTTKDLVEECLNYWAGNWEIINTDDEFKEAKHLSLSSEKSIELLNWSPKLNFEKTVRFTINWYKNFYNKMSAYECCINDVKRFFQISI